MKDKLLPQLLGAALLCLSVQRGAAPRRHRPRHKDTHSAGGVALAKHDSSSVSKVASGERRPQQRRRQNELIQAAASVGVKQSPVRSGACSSPCWSQGRGKQGLCALDVSRAQQGRAASVLALELKPSLTAPAGPLPSCCGADLLAQFSSLSLRPCEQQKYLCSPFCHCHPRRCDLLIHWSVLKCSEGKQTNKKRVENSNLCVGVFLWHLKGAVLSENWFCQDYVFFLPFSQLFPAVCGRWDALAPSL